ncbi:MAG: patatin-like phospholipase family protein [Alphaproteobacteria bacterium]|nr:patatin-like phospholipase family protein [Alphaproteobacteria bacterium]
MTMPAQDLTIAAGPSALKHIRENGLAPNDISTIFGASGAAKWLAIAGLDHAVFSEFMPQRSRSTPVDLFGTSVGAFKLSASARKDPGAALLATAKAYVEQSYQGATRLEAIDEQTGIVLNKAFAPHTPDAIQEILSNERYRLHIGTVRCHGGLNSANRVSQGLALARAGLLALGTHHHLRGLTERAVFSDPRSPLQFRARDGYAVRHDKLTPGNFMLALRASGSIPIYMSPVRLPEDPAHIYHDGGMLDYHPVPGTFWPDTEGLILYPHFYDHFKMRWFDKFYPWRKAPPHLLDNVVMVAPSRQWVGALPDGKIPSRQDFTKYLKNENERFDKWNEVVRRSHALGEEFIHAAETGSISDLVVPL